MSCPAPGGTLATQIAAAAYMIYAQIKQLLEAAGDTDLQ
jgi:hypothetical protein